MPEYLSPGVYVEEIDKGPKPIEGVGTSTAVFIGFSEKAQATEAANGETVTRDLLNKPVFVTNWSQYVEKFGGFVDGAYMPMSVYGFFQNGGARCYVVSVKTIPKAQAMLLNSDGKPQLMVRARTAGFGGTRLRASVVSSAPAAAAPAPPPDTGSKKSKAAAAAAAPDAAAPADGGTAAPPPPAPAEPPAPFTLRIERERASGGWQVLEEFRETTLAESFADDGTRTVAVAFKNKTPTLVDVAVADGAALPLARLWPREQQQSLNIDSRQLAPATTADFQGDVMERTGVEGLEEIDDITMVIVPDLMTTLPGQKLDLSQVKAVQTMIIAHCERMRDRVAVLDTPPGMNPQQMKKWRMDTTGFDSSYATMYYPWIEVADPINNRPMLMPPSGHMAGIWARSDNTRGVHKAPANEVVRGATGLAYNCTKGEQDILNPNGINCIRAFPGMGIRVWGARTLSSNPSWRYVNVRRLFNFVEKSIERGTQWVVFEPNEPRLWARVRRDVSAFLTTVWRDGALFGSAPSEAFFVKCDSELNPPESIDLGRLIIEIGMSPVKPAEFVIFRISQWRPGME